MSELQESATSSGPAIPTFDGVATNDLGGRTILNTDLAPAADECTDAAEIPTQQGPNGLRFDFNDGCRVMLPMSSYPWQVKLSDLDTGNVVYQTEIKGGSVNSIKRYFVRFRLEVCQRGQVLLCHDYTAADRKVLISFPVETLGDTIGWFPYAVKSCARFRTPTVPQPKNEEFGLQ